MKAARGLSCEPVPRAGKVREWQSADKSVQEAKCRRSVRVTKCIAGIHLLRPSPAHSHHPLPPHTYPHGAFQFMFNLRCT